MKGKERILAAMKLEPVDQTPWIPFVGCHGGKLIGVSASEYLRSEDNTVAGATEAIERYGADGIPVVFDLQVEAEILGCELRWSDENPPAVRTHPFKKSSSFDNLATPKKSDGRIPLIMNAARRIRQNHPDIALYGLITGPFTLAMHLYGSELFMNMYHDEASTRKLLAYCKQVCFVMSDYYIEAGCDIIALVDPMTSQIGPKHFQQFLSQPEAEVIDHIREKGVLSSFLVCGQSRQNIELMCECNPDNVFVDENTPLAVVKEVALKKGISFGGNLQLAAVLLFGKPDDVLRNVRDCIKKSGNKGFILAPGWDLPYLTPFKNLETVAGYVNDSCQRKMAKTLPSLEQPKSTIDVSDYGNSGKITIDIITLDSESCAPCQYMVESVREVMPQFKNVARWQEHKIKRRASLQFMASLRVINFPTICIDGEVNFVSRIPPRDELVAAIQNRLLEKLKLTIGSRRGSLIILGRTTEECMGISPKIKQAIRELGSEVSVEHIVGEESMELYGVSSTPAVVTARYKIESEGTIPEVHEIKQWIRETL